MGLFTRTPKYIQGESKTTYIDRHVTVHEHKAPTDQSVRLLKEMEEAALKKLIYSVEMRDNHLDAEVFFFQIPSTSLRIKTILKFKLNSKDYRFDMEFDYTELRDFEAFVDSRGYHRSHIIEVIHKKFAEVIARDLLQKTVNDMAKKNK